MPRRSRMGFFSEAPVCRYDHVLNLKHLFFLCFISCFYFIFLVCLKNRRMIMNNDHREVDTGNDY